MFEMNGEAGGRGRRVRGEKQDGQDRLRGTEIRMYFGGSQW